MSGNQHEAITIKISDDSDAPRGQKSVFFLNNILIRVTTWVCYIVAYCVAFSVTLPLLLVSFLVVRFVQSMVVRCDRAFDRTYRLNFAIRSWIYADCAHLIYLCVILYAVAQTPLRNLKHLTVLGSPLINLIEAAIIILSFACFSYIISIYIIRCVMFCIPLKYHTVETGSLLVVPHAVHEFISCLIVLLVEQLVIKRLPLLKHYNIFGVYPAHESLHVAILVVLLYNLITLSIYMSVWQLHNLVTYEGNNDKKSLRHKIANRVRGRKFLLIWAQRLKHDIIFILSTITLFLVWALYFGLKVHEHGTTRARNVFQFGNWTCLSLFIFSILWMIKTCILLLFETRVIYRRLGHKIFQGAKQLYFLGLIGRQKYDIFNLQYDVKISKSSTNKNIFDCKNLKEKISRHPLDFTKVWISYLIVNIFSPAKLIKVHDIYKDASDHHDDDWDIQHSDQGDQQEKRYVKKLSKKRREKVKDALMLKRAEKPTMYELQQMAQYFLAARKFLIQDKYISDILQTIKMNQSVTRSPIDEEVLRRLVKDQISSASSEKEKHIDWGNFEDRTMHYDGESSSIASWMKEAHKNCVYLASTLNSAKELVSCLDNIMSVLLIGGAIVLWLLLTGLATTKVFVLIASPLLALTFMIGDSCTTFIQGFVFVYMVHPFEVGDLCVIDGNMLEVKAVGVWTTIFSKVDGLDTKVEVIYPNQDLMSKNIENHKMNTFDRNYSVEVYNKMPVAVDVNELKLHVTELLKSKHNTKPGEDMVVEVFPTAENKVKIVVNFIHDDTNLQSNMTHNEHLREKRKHESELIQSVHDYLAHKWLIPITQQETQTGLEITKEK